MTWHNHNLIGVFLLGERIKGRGRGTRRAFGRGSGVASRQHQGAPDHGSAAVVVAYHSSHFFFFWQRIHPPPFNDWTIRNRIDRGAFTRPPTHPPTHPSAMEGLYPPLSICLFLSFSPFLPLSLPPFIPLSPAPRTTVSVLSSSSSPHAYRIVLSTIYRNVIFRIISPL